MIPGSAPRPRDRMLLAVLVVVWAASWPIIKVGVTAMPPVWFACWRYLIAACCLAVLVAARRELALPSASDWRLVVVSGVLQMGAYSALTGLALTILPPGRASVLAFSTPLWVVPLAAWRLGERATPRALAGVAIGLAGVLTIAAPAVRPDGGRAQVLSYAMLMGAAALWAVSIVFVRGHRFEATPLALAPWQALVAAAVLSPVAFAIEGPPPAVAPRAVAALAYVAPVATAFAYWAVVEVGRRTPASTTSMALLATPSLGLLISALTLGETVSASLVAGIALVAVGIRLASARAGAGRAVTGGDASSPAAAPTPTGPRRP